MSIKAKIQRITNFHTLKLTTNQQVNVDNYGTDLAMEDCHGPLKITIYNPDPADLRAMAQALLEGADEIEGAATERDARAKAGVA